MPGDMLMHLRFCQFLSFLCPFKSTRAHVQACAYTYECMCVWVYACAHECVRVLAPSVHLFVRVCERVCERAYHVFVRVYVYELMDTGGCAAECAS